MNFKIAVLPGDGIGPEISVQGVDVMTAVCEKFGHKVSYKYALCGRMPSTKWEILSRKRLSKSVKRRMRYCSPPWATQSSTTTRLPKSVRNRDCLPCVRNWDCLPISARYKHSNACCISRPFVPNWWTVPTSFASVTSKYIHFGAG